MYVYNVFNAAVNFNFDGTLFPLSPVFDRTKSSSLRVTANGINVNEEYAMHIYHAVLWMLFFLLTLLSRYEHGSLESNNYKCVWFME